MIRQRCGVSTRAYRGALAKVSRENDAEVLFKFLVAATNESEVSRRTAERGGAAAGAIGGGFARYATDQENCQTHVCK